MRICLAGRPYDEGIDFDSLANMTENYVGSDIELIITEAARDAVTNDKSSISESMIIAVIDRFSPSVSAADIAQFKQFSNLERS